MATTSASLLEQARDQARGGAGSKLRDVDSAGAFSRGVVDGMRLRAYYPPTREFRDVTPWLTGGGYTDDETTAAVSGTWTFDNGDGQVGSFLHRPGMMLFLETRAGARKFVERGRFIAWATEVTDLAQGSLTVDFFDHLIYLQSLHGSAHYVADRNHPGGWTADQIAASELRNAKVPTAGLVRGKYKIKYFVLKDATLLDKIAKAYYLDSRKTGNWYFIRAEKGMVRVRRAKKRTLILAVDDRANMRQGSFRRELSDDFAVSVVPRGGDPDKSGKRKPAKESKKEAAKSARETQLSANKRLASAALFGAKTYEGDHFTVHDPTWTAANAQRLADRLGRTTKTLTLTIDGNVLIEQGDRVFVRLQTSHGRPMRRAVYVSSVTQSFAPGDHSTQLVCRWREKEASAPVDLSDLETRASKTTTSKPESGDKFSKDELVQLCEAHDFPDPNLMAAIMMAESDGDPAARNYNTNGTIDRGLGQVNSVHSQYDGAKLYDADYNADACYEISDGGTNFEPWATYQSGAFRGFL
jgi:hypothetical protein